MSRDPEGESLAGLAAWKAHRTWDPEKSSWKTWTYIHIRQALYDYWREQKRRREVLSHALDTDEIRWEESVEYINPDQDTHEKCLDGDWQLLVEVYVDNYPLPVVARRNNMSIYTARQTVAAAVARLNESLSENEFV